MQIIYRMQKISNFLLNQTQVPQTTFYKVSVFTLSYPAWALAMHSLQVKQDRELSCHTSGRQFVNETSAEKFKNKKV